MRSADSAAPGLALQLREGTRSVHTRAERTAFIRGFLRGVTTVESYVRLLAALHPVYRAMEEALAELSREDRLLASFNLPRLHRAAALERDLVHLAGCDWRAGVAPMQESARYAARIVSVAREEPRLLVGHLYTRYLGDLAGGQVLARIAGRCLGLAPGAGLDFYDFGAASRLPELKADYRWRLDAFGREIDVCMRQRIVQEAIFAFRCNIAVFERLHGSALTSALRLLRLPWLHVERRPATRLGPATAL
jgi:heme oxygenase